MITFQAQGGLGNQLFQYAAARRLAIRHDCQLVVDHHWFSHPRRGETPRSLELNRYSVVMRLATTFELLRLTPLRSRWGRLLKPLMPMNLVREQACGVNREALSAPLNSYLSGFWQSEAYFADIREQLLQELTPIEPPGPDDLATIDRIQNGEAISVHVRRGDYVSLASASAYHGLCTLDYYRKAIAYAAERVSSPTLFVFSDDPEWTKANLRSPFPTYYVDHNAPDRAFQDLRLMSLCRHHILANSSFSWWGAWLSSSTDGLVIAPERWYAIDRPTPDLIPSRWIRIAG
jgi:hypothetical protein